MEHVCLNCQSETSGKFCANCGQKTDTHRITFGHFLTHDLLHGTFHLDRGILFTMKEAIRRPGKAALDYISGKRIRYYNVFYLSLILTGLFILISHTEVKGGNKESIDYINFFSKNVKLILLCFVPLFAVNGKILFWKMKLNIAEHFIVAGFTFVGVLIAVNIMTISETVFGWFGADVVLTPLLVTMLFLAILFPVWSYGNLAWKTHSFLGFIWRIAAFYILLFAEVFFLLGLSIWLVTGSSGLTIN